MLIPFGVFSAAGAGGGASAGSFDLISTTLISSATASVTFDVSTLASTYKHLQFRTVAKNTENGNYGINGLKMQFNGDTGANYFRHYLQGSGSSVSSGANTSQTYAFAGWVAYGLEGTFAISVCDILDFASSKNKTSRMLVGQYGANNTYVALGSSAWANTSAITSIALSDSAGVNLASGTRISLYGIKG